MDAISLQARTVREMSQRHTAFTQGSLRSAIFNAGAPPGTREHAIYGDLKPAIIRVGRRVLLDEQRFLEWLDKRRQA
jgi:hypothetical protein